MDGSFIIENLDRTENRIQIQFSATGSLGRFFNLDTFYVNYNTDISDVPDEILNIPVLANVAPACWATNSEIYVPTIDSEFAESLREVRNAFTELYPMLSGESSIHGTRVDVAPTDNMKGSGMLFSGGVDSLATFIRHKEEKPTLFLAQGIDIGLEEQSAWKRTLNYAQDFADHYGTEVQTMQTNCYSFISRPMLSAYFADQITDNSWWSGVQHGMGLLGLCAPLAYKKGLSNLFIGSTHTEAFQRPWGSHPKIDNRVHWKGTQCHHDSYDLTRQEKVQLIADHSESKHSSLKIRSCFNSAKGGNCGHCEKCCRTIIGLDIANATPAEFGFPVDLNAEFYQHVRSGFEDGRWMLGHDELYMWTDLQNHVSDDIINQSGTRGNFYAWFSDLDLNEYRKVTSTSKKRRLLWWAARNMPKPIFDLGYPIYNRIS